VSLDSSTVEEIRSLTHEYAYFVDTRQAKPWCGLFAEESVLDFSRAGGAVLTGLPTIRRFADSFSSRVDVTCHIITNHLVRGNQTTATGVCYAAVHRWVGEHHSVTTGRYEDEYRADNSKWMFVRRAFLPFV
jgi:hypothetical protein